MKIAKWGNSLAVRLPTSLVAEFGLKEDDDIEIVINTDRKLEVQTMPSIAERLSKLRQFQGLIPNDFKFDREEANSR
jgi:antitoxin MazE